MTQFEKAAIDAVNLFRNQAVDSPNKAWSKAIAKYSKAKEKKQCPKCAFLGLCEEGLIKSIPRGKYTTSKKNKQYAVKTVELIRTDRSLLEEDEKEVWKKVMKCCGENEDKTSSNQVGIVQALIKEKMINLD